MTAKEPLLRFYELSGPKSWSPYCWMTRFALNYKRIPYTVTKISYPAIKPKCQELISGIREEDCTVPIIEVLGPNHEALNDSIPIAEFLNERFKAEDGYEFLRGVDEVREYGKSMAIGKKYILIWIVNDVYENALDPSDGSREYFKSTREASKKCPLKDVTEVHGGGEESVLKFISEEWAPLRERMKGEDGSGEPNYIDFYDAGLVKWIEGASTQKYEKLLKLYGDDTFTKLMKKVGKYAV